VGVAEGINSTLGTWSRVRYSLYEEPNFQNFKIMGWKESPYEIDKYRVLIPFTIETFMFLRRMEIHGTSENPARTSETEPFYDWTVFSLNHLTLLALAQLVRISV
jgi:hypothetical protein